MEDIEATIAQVERSLTNITPSEDQIERIEMLRRNARDLARAVIRYSLPSRERSLAITKLEETVMWAVKGVLLNG